MRERELATFDENRRAVGQVNPMRDNLKSCTEGEKRRHLSPRLVAQKAVEWEFEKGEKKKKREREKASKQGSKQPTEQAKKQKSLQCM